MTQPFVVGCLIVIVGLLVAWTAAGQIDCPGTRLLVRSLLSMLGLLMAMMTLAAIVS